MKRLISAKEALRLYNHNPHLQGGFGHDFGVFCHALDKHHDNAKLSSFRYTFKSHQKNIQETVHGGALATMVDVITTVGILRLTPNRTISISLNTEFMSVIKVGEEVEIDTQVAKLGKNIVFTNCWIYTDPEKTRKLACQGQHIKAVIHEPWNFMREVL
jgi:acyl-coenzyme A thioesterase 13